MSGSMSFLVAVLAVAGLTGLVPYLGIRMLAPSLADSPLAQRTNYRGRVVFIGLGAVWVFWVAGMQVLRSGFSLLPALSLFVSIQPILPLTITALLFGIIDDAYGTSADRGFRGHLTALAAGRLTTGAFKLLGIGLVSLAAASSIGVGARGAGATPALTGEARALVTWLAWTLALGAVIALSANLVNLMDLRPGRALKAYLLYALPLVVAAAFLRPGGDALLLALALLGPAVAVWSLDLGERGMLGDAGANAAGAVLGFLAAWECGRSWPTLVVLVVLLAVNLASERWSFTRLIEANRLLRYLDGVGRHSASVSAGKSGPQTETPDR
jgi:hypothetical protein